MIKPLMMLLMLVLLSGCASMMRVESYYPEGKFPASTVQKIKIFYTDPPRPYQVLGSVRGEILEGLFIDDTKKLKEQAAAMGADAVIFITHQGACHEVLTQPERTVVEEKSKQEKSGGYGEVRSKTILSTTPAQYGTQCETWRESKIIRFTD